MKKFSLLFVVLAGICQQASSQCTPANLQPTANLNTPGYTLNTAFNSGTTSGATINGLSNGLVNFSAALSGTAAWGAFVAGNPATGGIQLQNDATVGNYIYVQPNNAPNNVAANYATYTFNFTEAVYNISFRAAGLNNQDRIIVTAFNGATPVTINSSNFTNLDAGITVTGNTAVGTSTAGGTSVNTNRATITVAGPVTQIVIRSGKADNSTSTVTLGFTSFGYTRCVNAPADINATFVNVPVSGNVGTNDQKPSGTTYGTPVAQPGNPGAAMPTVSSDGSYSFTSSVAGVFRFKVPMCPGGIVEPNCALVDLTITVSQPTVYTNNPFANTDLATTPINTAVTLRTLANDKAGNNSGVLLNPASVTITAAPLHGTTSINNVTGDITYTPASNYTGYDTLTYLVCDQASPTPQCATAKQIITIIPAGSSNTTIAADDYNSTGLNKSVSGNVSNNDVDPQGNTQTVTVQNSTVTGQGTFTLAGNGSYTFAPVNGFSGPIHFPYQVCDNGSPQACTNATLYLLVYPSFTLPLDLLSFSASVTNSDAKLVWETDNQDNVNRFEVERAPFNSSVFTSIGTVAINNGTAGTYQFTDVNAGSQFDKCQYRLKIVDNDGRYKYSAIAIASFGKSGGYSLRPSVVQKGQAITLYTSGGRAGKYTGQLYNASGHLVKTWQGTTGVNQQLQTDQLTRGVYIVRLVQENDVFIQRFTVQ